MNINIFVIVIWITIGTIQIFRPTESLVFLWMAIGTICIMASVINKYEKAFETLAIDRHEKRVKILKEEIE